MKLFISQPMKGKTKEEIEAERNEVLEALKLFTLKGQDVEVIDSFFKDAPHDAAPLWCLGESIKLLGSADIVYFCKDWAKYNGCVIEHECAVRYGKQVMYY